MFRKFTISLLSLFAILSFATAENTIVITQSYSDKIPEYSVETLSVRLYAESKNNSSQDRYGFIQFYLDNRPIGDPQPISITANSTDTVFFDTLIPPGSHKIGAGVLDSLDSKAGEIYPVKEIFVDRDFDGDKAGDQRDDDDDNDGVSDSNEIALGSNPYSRDSDADGQPDKWEIDHSLNPTDAYDATIDSDNDGLTNLDEYNSNTDPTSADSDGDGIPDGWEVEHQLNPNDGADASLDADNDGLSNLEEYNQSTNPDNSDSDGDGQIDGEDDLPNDSGESEDTDADGDGNNTDQDDDNDEIPDEEEINNGTDPTISDSDHDGVNDKLDKFPVDSQFTFDHDADGNPDETDDDDDNDGASDALEIETGSNPTNPDSDGDGLVDGIEITNDTNPLKYEKLKNSYIYHKEIFYTVASSTLIICVLVWRLLLRMRKPKRVILIS